jgi:predicted nucleic acid-binding protein
MREALDSVLDAAGISIATMPRPALFLAAKAFQRYRSAGGARSGVLPNFFIAAHAAVSGCTLLSRDTHRYRTCFPSVKLLMP